jgi:hypothetical protein
MLPIPGRIVVRKGQKIVATDVVAEANLSPTHVVLDIARGLGLPPEKLEKVLQRRAGEQIAEGDVIAGPVGMTRRVIRASRSGTIVQIKNGRILLQVDTPPFSLLAGMPGTVVDLIGERGVIVENSGALIQGVWGNGRIDTGMLNVQAEKPEEVLTADRLDVSQRGSVILAGTCEDANVFRTAATFTLRGLILSSMASALIPEALKAPFPILVIEGFGLLPLNSAVFNLLTAQDGQEATLNAEPYDRMKGTRPEVFIPLPATGTLAEPRESTIFSPGQRVRVVRAPHRSRAGTLLALRSGLDVFPSGVKAPAADVRLENGMEVILPLANLEVLE